MIFRTLTFAALLVAATATEHWRLGPIMIEAQDTMKIWQVPGEYLIARVKSNGQIMRYGQPIERLDRDELLDLVRDLIGYEVHLSAPGPIPTRKR